VERGFGTFINRQRTDRELHALGKFDAKLRQRLIGILSQLPAGVGRRRLHDAAQWLRPQCRGVGFEIDDLAMLLVDVVLAGASAALSGNAGTSLTPPRRIDLSPRLCARCQRV
jgi:hypothetical protein